MIGSNITSYVRCVGFVIIMLVAGVIDCSGCWVFDGDCIGCWCCLWVG